MEVMGLMLGQFVDDYTITCVDVFAMPQVCWFFFTVLCIIDFIRDIILHDARPFSMEPESVLKPLMQFFKQIC